VKKIGIVDYYLDEWHANHYGEWINAAYGEGESGYFIAYAYGDKDKPGGLTTDEWCLQNGVERMNSIHELVEKSDAVIVLSPDNPEHHLRLASPALESGKPLFIDKTFAPTREEGQEIFDLAAAFHTPVYSTSCLRYSNEIIDFKKQAETKKIEQIALQGPGNFEIYIIHQLEMMSAVLGTGAKRVKCFSTPAGRTFIVEYADGRLASLIQCGDTPYSLRAAFGDGTDAGFHTVTDLWENTIRSIFTFFDTGKAPVSPYETLDILAVRDAMGAALMQNDIWFPV